MKRGILTSLAVLLAWTCGSNFASAQFGSLGQQPLRPRPTVSPYINLGAGAGALSYYGLIRPQVDMTRQIMTMQNALTQMNPDGSLRSSLDQQQQQSQTGSQGVGLTTGHAATYFNYSHYYPLTGMGSQGGPSFLSGMGGLNPGVGGSGTFGGLGGAFGGGRSGGPSIVIGVGR